MEDSSGTWQDTPEAIESIVIDYFSLLFTTSNPSDIGRVVDIVQVVVSDPMNSLLGSDFQAMEVQQALNQMHPTMALALMVCLLSFLKNSGLFLVIV